VLQMKFLLFNYDIIKADNFVFGHGSRDKFGKETRRKCADITVSETHLLLSVPEVCGSKNERNNEVQSLSSLCILSSKVIFTKT
jgi:hypothetical protein